MKTYLKIPIILILNLFCLLQNNFAQDSLSLSRNEIHKFLAEPMKATMMAVVFPGLGQIYNRKYWKIPVVYAGFGGLIYSIGYNSSNYLTYMKAYQDFTDEIYETSSYIQLIRADPSTYDPVRYPDTYLPSNASYYKDGMLRMVDQFKRYRDLSYIGVAAWYLISILDANVDASLFNYDISNNLDIAVAPIQLPLQGTFLGAGINVSLKVTF